MKLFTSPADMIGDHITNKLFDLHDEHVISKRPFLFPYRVHSDKLHNRLLWVAC